MALNLVRSMRMIQSSGLQKFLQNTICRSKHLLAPEKYVYTTVGLKSTILAKVDENTVSDMKICNTASKKPFHSSSTLFKRRKESDYETLRILDPDGQFFCTAEMLILEKFCHKYRRYTFKEVTSAESDQSANASEADSLRKFQLVDKQKDQPSTEAKDKKIKTIQFHKETSPDEKLQKIFKILVDEGKVNVTFDKVFYRFFWAQSFESLFGVHN